MRLVIDVEANSLVRPSKIWVIVCKDIDTGTLHIFREVTSNEEERDKFLQLASKAELFIGHNFLGYDWPVLRDLIGFDYPDIHRRTIDTLIISKLVNYSREKHSIENYGEEFNYPKIKFNDFTKYTKELEDYCVRDVDICHLIFNKHSWYIDNKLHSKAILLEHRFQLIVNDLHDNGFSFNVDKAELLRAEINILLAELDKEIEEAFPPQEVLIREFTPRATKHGTISKTSVPRSLWGDIHLYEVGRTYNHTKTQSFNPSSHKQLIGVLNTAGWRPENKTASHIETEREINRLRYSRDPERGLTLKCLHEKLDTLKIYGWKVDEFNLSTLPQSAPSPARSLAKRILLESRRRTLTEWLGLVQDDGRIHGKFYGIGTWTHRMAHQQPNTANIASEFNLDGTRKLYGRELRKLWRSPKNRLLVGVDAEGIQLRIFAHYIDDPEFTKALVEGKKDDQTDPHSLNRRVLGSVCKTRAAAKRFIYALLLGAGIGKLAQILECSVPDTQEALSNLLRRYQGFKKLKQEVIPKDAKRGWFTGLDDRTVPIPGQSLRDRQHLAMSGYLQNGEAIIIKRAAIIIDDTLSVEKELRRWFFVNIVHDELQSEIRNSRDTAFAVAKIKADAIRQAGEELKLRCPLAGSYWNDDHKDYTIGTDWYATH